MSREAHVQFCERLGVRFPGATHPLDNPILGAQELLRFARVKAMLQAG
jgi:hypothetical protein